MANYKLEVIGSSQAPSHSLRFLFFSSVFLVSFASSYLVFPVYTPLVYLFLYLYLDMIYLNAYPQLLVMVTVCLFSFQTATKIHS